MGVTGGAVRLVACEIFFREVCAIVARSPHRVDLTFLPQGLHDRGSAPMRDALQRAVNESDPAVHGSVLLAYGLCGNGLVGLAAPGVPLVVPRAHDCITCLLGSKERYEKEFARRPGTYWRSSGWLERAGPPGEANQLAFGNGSGHMPSWETLVEKYGEEDAREIRDAMTSHLKTYTRLAYIRMGVEPGWELEPRARAEAAALGWIYEAVPGDLGLLRRLVDGPRDDADFLTVHPGWRIRPAYDGSIIAVEPVPSTQGSAQG